MRRDISGWSTRLDDEMISRFTAEGSWRGVTLVDFALSTYKKNPDQIAIVDGDKSITFRQLCNSAMRVVGALRRKGLVAGDVISFQLPNWYETVVINLAASLGGFVCNPIVPIYRDAEVKFILKDAKAKVFFVPREFRSTDYAEMVRRIRADLPALRDVVLLRGNDPEFESFNEWMSVGDDDIAFGAIAPVDANAIKLLLYTSGTTGNPKGVLHSHNTLGAEVAAASSFWSITEQDVVLMPSPVTHITGYLYALEFVFALGLKVVFMEKWNASQAVQLIKHHRVTFSVGATPFLAELVTELEAKGEELLSVRLFACGGAPVPPEVVRRASRALPSCQVCRIFGSSEAPTVTLGVAAGDAPELGGITDGCITNHDVRIVDPITGECVPTGREGEILTRGPEVMLGYTRMEDTLAAFDGDGFFRTGDLGYISHGRYLTISGRKKDLIIRGGENISPKEIEDAIHKHPSILEAAVVAKPHQRMGETAMVFAVLRPGAQLTLEELVQFLEEEKLAKQKFPELLVVVDELPKTATGKVLKHVLRARGAEIA